MMYNPINFTRKEKKIEYVKCPCGTGHDIVKGSIINRCPHLYVQIIAASSRGDSKKSTFEKTPIKQEPKDEEMEKAWSHFVESGDFDAVRNLREQRELSNWFMNRWD